MYYGQTKRDRLLAIVLTERDNKIRVITAYELDAAKSGTTWSAVREGSDVMRQQREAVPKLSKMPKFVNEDEEAKWWASAEGREFLKQQSGSGAKKPKGSPLVANLSRASSVQIALRLPAPDLAKARKIADRKGIGYQTLLKMLLHEGLRREARRE